MKRTERTDFDKLEKSAQRINGSFLDIFYSVHTMLSDQGDNDATRKAYFCAWHASGQEKPKTKLALAKKLEIRRPTLSEWLHQQWFIDLNLGQLRQGRLLSNLEDIDAQMVDDARTLSGREGVAAREQYYQQVGMGKAQGATQAVQINIGGSAWQDEVLKLYEQGQITHQDIIDELGTDTAQEFFESAGIAYAGIREAEAAGEGQRIIEHQGQAQEAAP